MYLNHILPGIVYNSVAQILVVSKALGSVRNLLRDLIAIVCFSIIEFFFTEVQESKCNESIRFILLNKCIPIGS